jgi:hypothetical protein
MQKSSQHQQNAGPQPATRRSARPLEPAAPAGRLDAPAQLLQMQAAFGNRHVQRQLFTPLGAGGGYSGLMERDRRQTELTRVPPTSGPNRIKVWFNTFIPDAQVPGPPGSECFSGDNRGFSNAIHASSRTHQEIEFDVSTLTKTIDFKDTGTSHEVNCTTGAVMSTGKAPTSGLTNGSVTRSSSEILVDFLVEAVNPLVRGAPAIDASVVFHVDPAVQTCRLTGQHDGFPAYEAYVTADGGAGVTVHTHDPRTSGDDIMSLFPPMDEAVATTAVSF